MELCIQTFCYDSINIYVNPVIYLVLAFAYLIIGYHISTLDKNESLFNIKFRISWKIVYLFSFIILTYFSVIIFEEYISVVDKFEINPHQSDIIPSIQIYVQRFITGQKVYTPIPMPGYNIDPDYVTFQWIPYVIPQLLKLDYRLFSMILFFVFIAINFLVLVNKNRRNLFNLFIPVTGLVILYYLIIFQGSIFGRTLELTIAVYYMILSLTILNKNRFVLVAGILICLLSRYSLSFWLVSYVLIILLGRGFKEFVIINFYILLGILIFFIPFISHDLSIFIDGLKYYNKATLGEWKVQDWQMPGEKPFTISRGYGFALYFYDFIIGAVEKRLNTLRIIHLIISFISGVSLFIIYLKKKNKIKDIRIFLMFGLKFFLMIFFVFIQIPYNYLFIVPLFLTLPILSELIYSKKILLTSI